MKFTKAEWADVSDALHHYRNDWIKQQEEFYIAYISKNNLGRKDGKGRAISDEEMAGILSKMNGIKANERTKKLVN